MLMTNCTLCGEPMPPGEGMFKFHGYSGGCPKPPLMQSQADRPGQVNPPVCQLTTMDQMTVRSLLHPVECSHSGMSYGDEKNGAPSDYARGFGDCLKAVKKQLGIGS